MSRSEEHTSELQSRLVISYAVFCLKKKKTKKYIIIFYLIIYKKNHNNKIYNINLICLFNIFLYVLYLFIFLSFFFFNDTAPTEIYTTRHTLSLHDALPISCRAARARLQPLRRCPYPRPSRSRPVRPPARLYEGRRRRRRSNRRTDLRRIR